MPPFAIYFPQFYPTPTNDAAWGKGFTDWSLVANSNMRRNWQLRAPMRGFYDGASGSVHREQIEEARTAGIGGFGLYHYWFFTHQELDAFERTLLSGAGSTMPWFLIWATESWSRRWLGDPTEIVHLTTTPSVIDIRRHCDHLAHCFSDPGYLRIENRPLLVIYNVAHFSRPDEVIATYRLELKSRGFTPYIAQFVKKIFDRDYTKLVDGSYLFEPRLYFSMRSGVAGSRAKKVRDLIAKMFGEAFVSRVLVEMDRVAAKGMAFPSEDFLDYMGSDARAALLATISGDTQEVISPGWNNSPRYGSRFTAIEDLERTSFERLLGDAMSRSIRLPVLVNAWNEWSEGAAIEPCAYLGRRYLDAVASQTRAIKNEQ
jgi:Glycosyltransferase WbsX